MDNLEEKETQLQQVESELVGDLSTDLKMIREIVRQDKYFVKTNEELRQGLRELLENKYPDRLDTIHSFLSNLESETDDEFIANMFRLLEEDRATEAQFEMGIFVHEMEEELYQFKPKLSAKYLSLYSLLDLFEFHLHEEKSIELKQTPRNYAGLYISYAEILIAANERIEAAEAYRHALLWNPYDTKTIYKLADLYFEMGQYGMSYATTMSGLNYSLRVSDLAQGFYYLGKFFETKGDLLMASQLYQISTLWDKLPAAENKLTYLEEKENIFAQSYDIGQAREFLLQHGIQDFPSRKDLMILKSFASRMLVSKNYRGAYVYYGFYDEVTQGQDEEAHRMVEYLEAKIKK